MNIQHTQLHNKNKKKFAVSFIFIIILKIINHFTHNNVRAQREYIFITNLSF